MRGQSWQSRIVAMRRATSRPGSVKSSDGKALKVELASGQGASQVPSNSFLPSNSFYGLDWTPISHSASSLGKIGKSMGTKVESWGDVVSEV